MSKSDLINAVSALAIVVGLILVYIELRQSRDIAEAQMFIEVNGAMLNADLAILGENAAEVRAKECYAPAELTPTDWEVLVSLRRGLIRRAIDQYRLQEKNLWDELAPERITRNVAYGYLGTPIGRYMWKNERERVMENYPQIAAIFDEVAASIPKGVCLWENQLDDYLNELAAGRL